MKLVSTRIVTADVPTLARFYEKIMGLAPVGTEDFVLCYRRGKARD